MEVFNCVIDCMNSPEAQEILKDLDSERDILLTSVEPENNKIEVQFIQPINQLKTVGSVPSEITEEIFEKYGEEANVDISDYMVTFENGMYGLVADITVEEYVEDEEPKHKRLPFPLLVVVGTLTALLTGILVIIKVFKAFGKKK